MRSADVRRAWWLVSVVVLGVLPLLLLVTGDDGGGRGDGYTVTAQPADQDTSGARGSGADACSGVATVWAPWSGTTDRELVLGCLGLVASVCVVALVGLLCWLVPGGRSEGSVSTRAAGRSARRVPVGRAASGTPVRLRLCVSQV